MQGARSTSGVDQTLMRLSLGILLGAALIAAATGYASDKTELTPELFAPGIISTQLDESSGSFAPDGQSFYFCRRGAYTTSPPISIICVSGLRDGKWMHPEVALFSGTYLDGSPYFSPDGKRLYFSSKRPTASNPNGRDWNIWYVDKIDNGWSNPKEVGEPVNGPGNDSNPAVAADGTLYFASDRDGAAGYFRIYRARLTNGHYEQPVKLGLEINSGEAEINPYISPDQKVLIFGSFTRKDTLSAGGNPYTRADLYISTNRDDRWTPARHLEHGINTTATEGNPSISPDGKWFYFTSERSPFEVPMKQPLTTAAWQDRHRGIENGVGNIYRISVEALELNR
jgi:Tol biopolymer transport system component